MSEYVGWSPSKLLEEVDRLGWRVELSEQAAMRIVPKPATELPADLMHALWEERLSLRVLLELRAREKA